MTLPQHTSLETDRLFEELFLSARKDGFNGCFCIFIENSKPDGKVTWYQRLRNDLTEENLMEAVDLALAGAESKNPSVKQ